MHAITASAAWLPEGWACNVRIELDDAGMIAGVTTDAAVDATERIEGAVIPGLCNLHSHAFQRAMAGLAERSDANAESFWSWRDVMYRVVARLSPETLESIAAQLYVDLLKGGFTSVCEFHYVHRDVNGAAYANLAETSERVIAAAAQANIGLTLLPVVYMASGFGGQPPHAGQRRFVADPDMALRIVESLRPREHSGLRLGIAPHSLRAVPPDALRALVSGRAGNPIHLHIAEQTREVEDCLAWSGRRPVEWLLEREAVGPDWCLVHATHATRDEIAALARTGAVAGLCPTTEANLGDGFFALDDYLRSAGRYGIGTDSHVSASAAEELRWLEYGQRLTLRRRNVALDTSGGSVGETLYRAALAGGAQAAGRSIAGIEVGQRADFVVLDTGHPAFLGRESDAWLDAFVFCNYGSPVRDVMVGGEWVVRDGHHPREQDIAARFVAALRRLAS